MLQLGRLQADLDWGGYRPQDLIEVRLADSPSGRRLQIPPVRDRIVARAMLRELTPLVDPELGPASFAYRPGLGVVDAVQRLARLRDEGLGWVLRTDVDDCFPTVPIDRVERMLAALVPDEQVVRIVGDMLRRDVVRPGEGAAPDARSGAGLIMRSCA